MRKRGPTVLSLYVRIRSRSPTWELAKSEKLATATGIGFSSIFIFQVQVQVERNRALRLRSRMRVDDVRNAMRSVSVKCKSIAVRSYSNCNRNSN